MKILSCNIENFGKLHNFSLDFNKDIHMICEDNGYGKSTLMAFLRVMFYGFEGEKKKHVIEKEREKFRPWQGGVYGGQLTFSIGDKIYEISRVFGQKESEDQFELRDGITHFVSKDYSSHIGKEIFGMDAESFQRTIYIGENDCKTYATSDMNAKMDEMTDHTGDVNGYDAVAKQLSKYLNELRPDYKKSKLYLRKEQRTRLEMEVLKEPVLLQGMESLKEKIEKEQGKRTSILQEIHDLEERFKNATWYQNNLPYLHQYEALCEQYEKASRELEEVKMQGDFTLQNGDMKVTQEEMKPKAGKKTIFLSAIVLGTAGVISFFWNSKNLSWFTYVLLFLSVCLFFVFLLGTYQNMKHKKRNEQEKNAYENLFKDINEKRKIEAESSYETIRKKIEEFEDEHDVQNLLCSDTKKYNEDLHELQAKIHEKKEEESCIEQTLKQLQVEQDLIEEEQERLKDKKEELNALKEEIVKMTQKYERLVKTGEYLQKAKENLMAEYTEPFSHRLEHYLDFVFQEKAQKDQVYLDVNGEITIKEQGMYRNLKLLSAGYQDLLSVCMRFAFLDVMFKEEKPWIILDDPFVHLDDNKMRQVKALLNDMGETYQILYCTCSKERLL